MAEVDRTAESAADADAPERSTAARGRGPDLPFRLLLTVGLIVAAVLPLAVFGIVVIAAGWESNERAVTSLFALAIAGAGFFGLLAAYLVVASLTAPLRRITTAVERVAAGEPSPPIHLTGDDELARLAESHNRIAADVQRRNAELAALLTAIAAYAPSQGVEPLVAQAERDARHIYGLIDCRVHLGRADAVAREERVPGDPRPVRAEVRAGAETLGVLTGHLPATRSWERADQDLLELFASEVGVALRNAELFGRIESQNAQLRDLDEAKDEFLRGVSHNLQTPLTSIRAYVEQLRTTTTDAETDRRLAIVAEQSGRLTRLVRQLLTVTRLEAGVLRAEPEVIAMAPRVRRAWEALNATGATLELTDDARGWLAVADPDQLDQVLWALLDNAVKYGGREGTVEVAVRADDVTDRIQVTIADHGPGVAEADRERLFTRFTRGASQPSGEGTGLGLYVSRQLLAAMGGDLWLEPAKAGRGAAFTLSLPGEPPADEG
ncbi:MAG: ATP-binding protein [Candidatus Limnocylindrales bacterium]|jgi:signal transduction histidine kinase